MNSGDMMTLPLVFYNSEADLIYLSCHDANQGNTHKTGMSPETKRDR